MGLMREWELRMLVNGKLIDKITAHHLSVIVRKLAQKLAVICAIDQLDKGEFAKTQHYGTGDVLFKRYRIQILLPRTTFEIRKLSTGSINIEQFMNEIKRIKELYSEGI